MYLIVVDFHLQPNEWACCQLLCIINALARLTLYKNCFISVKIFLNIGSVKSPTLRFISLKVMTNPECVARNTYVPEPMPENQLCATDNQGDTVRGPCMVSC